MNTRFVAITLALMVAVTGCKKQDTAATTPSTPANQPAAAGASPSSPAGAGAPTVKPVPAQLPDVVAKVNGESVQRSELEMAIQTLESRAQSSVPPDQRDTVFRQVIDRIVGFHLLVQEAKTRKAVAPPWQVDAQVDQLKKQFPSEEAFNKMLQTRGITFDRLRQETADTVAVNQMLQQEIDPQIKVADPDMKAFFGQNKTRFHQDDSVHASHILIRADQNADATVKAKARATADDVLKKLKGGAKFPDLAKQFSQDPGSAPNGGDLGFFPRGQMVPAFEQVAFGLKVGQTSGVVETPYGYHIIRVSEAKPGRDMGYDEVKEQVREYLVQQQRDQKSQAFVDRLKAKSKIEILF